MKQDVTDWINAGGTVKEDVPLKQGLKLGDSAVTIATGIVKEDVPLKQGLKLASADIRGLSERG